MISNQKRAISTILIIAVVGLSGIGYWAVRKKKMSRQEYGGGYSDVNGVINALVNINKLRQFVNSTPGALEFLNALWQVNVPSDPGKPVTLTDIKIMLSKMATGGGVPPLFDEFFKRLEHDTQLLGTVNSLADTHYSLGDVKKLGFDERRKLFSLVTNIDVGGGAGTVENFSPDTFAVNLKKAADALISARQSDKSLYEAAKTWGVSKSDIASGRLNPDAARKIFDYVNKITTASNK